MKIKLKSSTRCITCVVLMLFGPVSMAANQNGTFNSDQIEFLRVQTSHITNTLGRNFALFNITGLNGGCTRGVYINSKDNSDAYSSMLAAFMAKRAIKMQYDSAQPTPWGDATYCAITSIDILP